MATGPRYNVAFRRRREGRTNYYTRRKLLASHETRAVVRRSNKNITVQFADFTMTGDKIIAAADTKQFKALGWEHSCSSIPAPINSARMRRSVDPSQRRSTKLAMVEINWSGLEGRHCPLRIRER